MVTTAIELCGAAAIVAGFALIYPPLGLIVFGVLMILIGMQRP